MTYSPEKRHAYYLANRERFATQSRAYADSHPTELATYSKAYRVKHHQRLVEQNKAYRSANRAHVTRLQRARADRTLTDVRAFKMLRGCIDCGYDENADALQFDHVRGEKYAAVTMLVGSREKLLAEIAKCDVRCANCHAIVTAKRRREAEEAARAVA